MAAPKAVTKAPKGALAISKEPAVIVLGVDPGTVVTGFGVIEQRGSALTLLAHGAVRLDRHAMDHPARLKKIFDTILGVLDTFAVTELAVEAPFYGTNVQSMLKLGRAQGVVMATALLRGVPVAEYPPARVKQSVTGRGAASKEQVRQMVLRLLPELSSEEAKSGATPAAYDTTDALAVALCHLHSRGKLAGPKASPAKRATSAWASFAAANEGRIVGGS